MVRVNGFRHLVLEKKEIRDWLGKGRFLKITILAVDSVIGILICQNFSQTLENLFCIL